MSALFSPEPGVPVAPTLPPLEEQWRVKPFTWWEGGGEGPLAASDPPRSSVVCVVLQALLVHVQFSGPRAMLIEPHACEAARFMAFPSIVKLEKFPIVMWERPRFSGSRHEPPTGLNLDVPCNGRVPQGGLKAPGCPLATVEGGG